MLQIWNAYKKTACKIIVQENYSNYVEAQNCTKTSQVKDMFPLNQTECDLKTRSREKFHVTMSRTGRLKDSSVPYMQRLMNNNVK